MRNSALVFQRTAFFHVSSEHIGGWFGRLNHRLYIMHFLEQAFTHGHIYDSLKRKMAAEVGCVRTTGTIRGPDIFPAKAEMVAFVALISVLFRDGRDHLLRLRSRRFCCHRQLINKSFSQLNTNSALHLLREAVTSLVVSLANVSTWVQLFFCFFWNPWPGTHSVLNNDSSIQTSRR